ncbi:MAG TPA: glycosyltransferase family 2 protein [Solirubrobacteraceae bacterium]|nr:glycosyltransferase family 2 protein [Solirubrobacteraceae bacterium]
MSAAARARPAVSVVVPFAGDIAEALMAMALLRSLHTGADDELILVDNCGVVPAAEDLSVVRATGERSPAHARNAGAARATCEWILFLDADTQAPPELLGAYFASPIEEGVGAVAGEIVGAGASASLAARYGAARNFLSQSAHMAHPFRPRAAAANLLVRRAAFEAAHGFQEGVQAGEDTDFCWRLQDLGWRLELRPEAVVEHRYRQSLGELRRQWRAYAAGRAWLADRYPDFHPEPAVQRALRRPLRALPAPRPGTALQAPARARSERLQFLALDALLAVEELIGLRMPNAARQGAGERRRGAGGWLGLAARRLGRQARRRYRGPRRPGRRSVR